MAQIACSTVVTTAQMPAATLDVRNLCPERMEVFANGQLLGRVDSGTYQRFSGLLAGPIQLDAYAMHGSRVVSSAPDLLGGGRFVWTLDPGNQAQAVTAPVGLGRIEVENRLPHDLDLWVDGEARARVLAGETRLLDEIPEGDRVVTAFSKPKHISFQHRAVVPVDGVLRWVVDDDKAELTILNKSSEPMVLTVDQGSSLRLGPGEQTVVTDLLQGTHSIEAVGLQSGRKYKTTVETSPKEQRTVELAGSDSGIRVINETGDSLVLRLDDMDIGRVGPYETGEFRQISQGNRMLTATAVASGQRFQTPAQLFSEQTFVWYVIANAATLAVANATDETVTAYLDGEVLMTLAPGDSQYKSQLPPGKHRLEAIGEQSQQLYASDVELGPERGSQWTVEKKTGSVSLRNKRAERLQVYVDAGYLAEIAPETSLTIDGVVPGERLFEAFGRTSYRTTRTRLVVEADGRPFWDIVEPTATVRVTNLTHETLEIDRLLASGGDTLGPGETAQYTVPAGDWSITLTGLSSQHLFIRRVTVEDGEVSDWRVEALLGDLVVHNRRLEPVRVQIDDLDVGVVAADSSETFVGLSKGPHEVTAISETGFVSRGKLLIGEEKPSNWEVRHETSGLQVTNTTFEDLDLFVDGRPYGIVATGESRLFGRIPAGTHTVSSFGKRTGRHSEVAMTFHEDEVARWIVEPQRTIARVHNKRSETAVVFVDGTQQLEILPGTTSELFVDHGPRHIDIHGKDSLDSKAYLLNIAPDQSYDFDFAEFTSKVSVENHVDVPLNILLDGHPVGTLAPTEKLEVSKVVSGRTLLEAVGRESENQRWQHRVTIRNGITEVWKITPASTPAAP